MEKQRKKKVNLACVYCRRSHMTCDEKRPCTRCIKRKIGHLCHDEPVSRKSKTVELSTPNSQQSSANEAIPDHTIQPKSTQAQPSSLADSMMPFYDEQLGSEINSFSEFLTGVNGDFLTYSGPTTNENSQYNAQSQVAAGSSSNGAHGDLNNVSATEKFMLTAADPKDNSGEGRLREVINAKYRAGLLKPFNYVAGYDRLRNYMNNFMNQASRQQIQKALYTFRPAFRSVAQSLSDVDLTLVEEDFERMLLDYDRIFASIAVPSCLWRRTGEIYRGNKEFAEIVSCSQHDLRDGKLAIYELMSEDSAVNFWEKYASIAFSTDQKAMMSFSVLRSIGSTKRQQCCFSFTIRRDRYNIPVCIVGNFIPIT